MTRKLRMAMIGGGPGAFIGPVHRLAAEMDGRIALVAGAFSRDPTRSQQAGRAYGIAQDRAYPSVESLLTGERGRDDPADVVAIVSPNAHHFPAASAAIAAGFAVVSDKPMTASLDEAVALSRQVARSGLPYALTYTYSGYPLVREARARVAAGAIGAVRKVVVDYPQGWLSGATPSKQAAWRLDPAQSGIGGCIADIGVHAFHLAEFVTGLRVTRLLADLGSVVEGRAVDDDCTLLLRFAGGARGVLMASQIAAGERNGLSVRVYGERGGLCWRQEHPNRLVINHASGTSEVIHAGAGIGDDARRRTRTPPGHPEGYLEAFANLYADVADILTGMPAPLLPGHADGLRSMALIDTAVSASKAGAAWVDLVIPELDA